MQQKSNKETKLVNESKLSLDERVQLISRELKSLRIESTRSRNDFSKVSQLSRHTITEVEEGNTQPTIGTLMKMTDALGVNCQYLFSKVEGESVLPVSDEHTESFVEDDQDLEKALYKLRRKCQTNPDLRSSIISLSRVQAIYDRTKENDDLSRAIEIVSSFQGIPKESILLESNKYISFTTKFKDSQVNYVLINTSKLDSVVNELIHLNHLDQLFSDLTISQYDLLAPVTVFLVFDKNKTLHGLKSTNENLKGYYYCAYSSLFVEYEKISVS